MDIETAQTRMDTDQKVKYKGQEYTILGINKLNGTVTLAFGPIGKDVKVEELD